MSEKETKIDVNILSGVLSIIVALLFGSWMNEVFDFGWNIPQEWIDLAWMILAGSLFAMVFVLIVFMITTWIIKRG